MANVKPLLVGVQGESWWSSIKASVLAASCPERQYVEIGAGAGDGDVAVNTQGDLTNNGDVWIFGHGYSADAVLGRDRFGIFSTFDSATQKGTLFDHAAMFRFFQRANTRRLYLFACYQGNYLRFYRQNLPAVTFSTGFTDRAQRASAGSFIASYFKGPDDYRMDRAVP